MTVTIHPRSSWTDTPAAWPTFPERLFTKSEVTYLVPHSPAIALDIWDDDNPAQEQEWLRTIRSWHVDGNGWADIGYALVIFQSGRAYMAGGITHSTAHAATQNRYAVGVLFMVGNDEPPSAAALDTFNQIGPWLRDTQGFTALSTVLDHGRLPGQATQCAGPHLRAAVDSGALTLTGGTMPTAQNGWSTIRFASTSTFLAPNGKIVYCRDANLALILGYIAWRWHFSIEPIAAATYLEGDSDTNHRGGVRDGLVAIHAWRPAAKIAGSSIYSIHGTGMAMDVNGHLHPYEYTAPKPYRSGFTNAQLAALRKIKAEIRAFAGADILRLGIDFEVGRRDGMHVEVWATAAQIARAARAIRDAGWLMPVRRGDIASYQAFIGTGADDFHGNGTTQALQRVQKSLRIGQTGRWDLPTRTATVQKRLGELGYAPGKVDGIPGPIFDAELRKFQRAARLEVDAIPGRATLAALLKAKAPTPTPPAPPQPPTKPDPPKEETVPPAPRLTGTDRYATAATVARQTGHKKVYLASSEIDAAVAAAAGDGAVLLVRRASTSLPGPTRAALEAMRPTTVLGVGAPSVVPDATIHAARAAAGITT